MAKSYCISLRGDTAGFVDDVFVLYGSLKQGKKVVAELSGDSITDFSSGLIKTLLKERPAKPVKMQIKGVFYEEGEQLLKDIVNLYNSSV